MTDKGESRGREKTKEQPEFSYKSMQSFKVKSQKPEFSIYSTTSSKRGPKIAEQQIKRMPQGDT